MKTMISTTCNKRKVLMTALLIAILGIGMGLYTAPAFAAGSYTLEGKYLDGTYEGIDLSQYEIDSSSTSTITLYRVGLISGTDLNIEEVLIPYMSDLMVDGKLKGWGTTAPEKADDKAKWTREWLDRAATIEGLINSNPDLKNSVTADEKPGLKVDETTVDLKNANFSFSGLAPGLYLVTGTGQKLSKYKGVDVTEGDAYIKPVPMLVQVIGNTSVELKPEVEGPVDKITVLKTWSGDSADTRPVSIDIKLTYAGKDVATLTLNQENNWTDTYDTGEMVDPTKWAISEASLTPGYTVTMTKTTAVNGVMKVTFTNTFNRMIKNGTINIHKNIFFIHTTIITNYLSSLND